MAPLMSLSDLPENVIDDIVSRLPTKDAGRTAVLSRSWRYRWRTIPDLDLSAVSDLGVSQALSLHVGPIRLFKVEDAYHYAIDRWLATLSSSSSASSSGCLHTLDLSSSDNHVQLKLGTLARFFPRLAHLRLAYGFMAMLPELDSSVFAILQTLHLERVYAFDDDRDHLQLSMFVPACPLLETLTVRYSAFCYILNSMARDYPRLTHLHLSEFLNFTIPSSGLTSLRTLNLVDGPIYGNLSVLFSVCPLLESLTLKGVDLMGEERLDIVAPAPNLRFLKLVQFRLESFSIMAAPVLETAKIDICVPSTDDESDSSGDGEASGSCNLIKVLGGMPSIKRLDLGHHILKFLGKGHVPDQFPVSLDHLRYMSLKGDLDDIGVLRVTLCLLRSTPNLQELDLKSSYSSDKKFPGVGRDFWKAQEHLRLFDNLERVNVTIKSPFGAEAAELEFIQFVLSKARVLMTMMVNLPHMSMRKKLLTSLRVSNRVKIIFTN